MAELYIFDQDDNFLNFISEETGLVDTWFKDYQNHLIDEPFIFNIKQNSPQLKYIVEENQVAFYDRDNDLRLMRIKEIYEESTNGSFNIRVKCEPSFLELYDHFIEDKRITNGTAQTAINRALEGSRYVGEVTVDLGLATDNFYWIDGIEAVFKIINTWGGALKDTITLNDKNEIIERKLWIVQRLGADNGLIVEPDYNAEEIGRRTLSYVETALWAQGASLEVVDDDGGHTGGYTRYITFEDVEWKVSNGDPVDKPKGQKWVGYPDALHEYGYLLDGVRKHRFGHFNNYEIEDPEELLWAAWNELQERKLKEIIHEAKINVADKKVSLGDTATIINRNYNKPIELQSQITGLEYDILDIDEVVIVVGKYVDLSEDPLQKDVDDLKEQINKPRPTKPIDNESFPDIKPGTPSNVMAVGGFQQIQIYWDYDSEVYISHYEVYGSKIRDFIPDSQHLLYRGRVSAFTHEVDTDETWYYRVRAVNRRGTASDYSAQVSAASVRINTPDIMFGSVTADLLANQLDIAEKLSQNTIDSINSGPMQAIVYTQQEIEATENRLINQLNSEIGDVTASIGSLNDIASNLIARANNTDDLLAQHNGKFSTIETDIDTINNRLTASITSVERIDDTVNSHSATLTAQANLINAKLDSLTYQQDKTGIINSIEANATEIGLLATGLELRVTKEEFDALSVGGRNLVIDSKGVRITSGDSGPNFRFINNENLIRLEAIVNRNATTNFYNTQFTNHWSNKDEIFENIQKGEEYTLSMEIRYSGASRVRLGFDTRSPDSALYARTEYVTDTEGKWVKVFAIKKESGRSLNRQSLIIGWFDSVAIGDFIEIRNIQLEKGNIPSDHQNAPEDTEAEITSVRDRVSSTETTLIAHAGLISARAEKSEVYTRTETNNLLGNKVDTTVYNNKVGELTTSINGISGRVSNTESSIIGLTGEISSAKSQIASLDIKANGIITSVSEVRADINNVGRWIKSYRVRTANPMPLIEADGRPLNDLYTYELTAKTMSTGTNSTAIFILKSRAAGSSGAGSGWDIEILYQQGSKTSNYPEIFIDESGVPSVRLYNHTSYYPVEITHEKFIGRTNSASVAEASITTLAGQVELKASQTSVNSLTNRMTTAEGTLSVLPGQINAKVDKNGVIAQINLSSEGVRIDGNKHHITGQTLIDNGVIGTAAIANLAVDRFHLKYGIVENIHIANATIEHTKMKSLNVDHVVAGQMDLVYLKAGTIDTDKFTVRGGSSIDYTEISGSTLRARGRFTRTWRGATETHDIVTQLHNGYLRFGNAARDRALNIADFGISTFADGSGDGSGERSSGTIEFFSRRFNSNYHGLTLYSSSVLGIDADKFRVMSQFDVEIESDNAIRFRPGLTMPGNNTFRLTTSGGNTASDIDGYFLYGSENDPHASGLRFSKRMSDPKLEVVDYKFETGGNTSIEAGFGYFNTVRRRSGNSYINIQHADIMQVGSDSNGDRIAMGGAYKRTYSSGANMHITEFGTVGRSTSARKYKRDIEPIDLSVAEKFYELAEPVFYRPQNTADDHMNYSYYGYIADDVAMIEPRLVTYNKEGEPEGFNYDRVPVLLHAVMRDKFRTLEDNLSMLELKNQYLTQIIKQQDIRIKQLEEKIA